RDPATRRKCRVMSERLIRALQRGGCLAPHQGDWGVWRGRDLRERCVGRLSAGAQAGLRVIERIRLEDPSRNLWVWSGPITPLPLCAKDRAGDPVSAFEQVVAAIRTTQDRTLAAAARQRFIHEMETIADGLAEAASSSVDMIRAELGDRGFGDLLDLCVCERTLASMARERRLTVEETRAASVEHLRRLTEIYGLRTERS
ncbi:MAG: hypothetical protein AAFY81_12080, partial [Pseudomonadota bacterium]